MSVNSGDKVRMILLFFLWLFLGAMGLWFEGGQWYGRWWAFMTEVYNGVYL